VKWIWVRVSTSLSTPQYMIILILLILKKIILGGDLRTYMEGKGYEDE